MVKLEVVRPVKPLFTRLNHISKVFLYMQLQLQLSAGRYREKHKNPDWVFGLGLFVDFQNIKEFGFLF